MCCLFKVSPSVQIKRRAIGRSPLLPIADFKAFLDKLHHERDSLFEAVATMTLESTFSIEEDVNQIIKAIKADEQSRI